MYRLEKRVGVRQGEQGGGLERINEQRVVEKDSDPVQGQSSSEEVSEDGPE